MGDRLARVSDIADSAAVAGNLVECLRRRHQLSTQLWALRVLCGVSVESMALALDVTPELCARMESIFGPPINTYREAWVRHCFGWERPNGG